MADKGLRVLVENEPASWSNTYPVKLNFKVSGAAITEIRINGTACTADAQGIVTYEADSGELEAEVDTDQSQTLKASIEIPMLDGEARARSCGKKTGSDRADCFGYAVNGDRHLITRR